MSNSMSNERRETLSATYLRRVPKVELHVHLEGAIRPARLLQVLRRHGLHRELHTEADLAWLYTHESFAAFLDHFRFVVTSLRDARDLHEVARDLFAELERHNVAYAEVLFSGAIFARQGIPWNELLAAVSEAHSAVPDASASHAPQAPQISEGPETPLPARRFNLVIDLVRNFGAAFAQQQVESLVRESHPAVVGIHLGGDEAAFPARDFAGAFRLAREAGYGVAAHAGEAVGPASVREAMDILAVTRIGHGIRSIEDARLVQELAARRVTLEVCPTSNLRTQVVEVLEQHPLQQLLRAGVAVTLSSDDPSFFDTDITRELQLVHERLGVDLETIDDTVDQGMRASFQTREERATRLAALQRERAALRHELDLEPSDGE